MEELPKEISSQMKAEKIDYLSVGFRNQSVEYVEASHDGKPCPVSKDLTQAVGDFCQTELDRGSLSAAAGNFKVNRKQKAVEVDFSRGEREPSPAGHPNKQVSGMVEGMAKAYNEREHSKGKGGRERD